MHQEMAHFLLAVTLLFANQFWYFFDV